MLAGQLGTPAPQAYLFPVEANPGTARPANGAVPSPAGSGLQSEISQLWTELSTMKAQASAAPSAATPAPPPPQKKPVELSGFPDFLQMREALKSCKRQPSQTPVATPQAAAAPPMSAPAAPTFGAPVSATAPMFGFSGLARAAPPASTVRRSLAASLAAGPGGETPLSTVGADGRLQRGGGASALEDEGVGVADSGAAVLGVENQRLRATLEHRAGDLRRALRELHCSQRQAQDLSIALATLEEKLTVTQEQVTVKDRRLRETEEQLERAEERYTGALKREKHAEEARRAATSDLERLKMEQEPNERRAEALEEQCTALAEQNRLLHHEMQKVIASTEEQLRKAAAGAALAERGEREAQGQAQETGQRVKRLERELKQAQKTIRAKSAAEQDVHVFGRNLTKGEVDKARGTARNLVARHPSDPREPVPQANLVPPAPQEAFSSPEPHTPRHNRERLQRRRDAANFAVKAELERTTQELSAMKSLRKPAPTRFVF